jgi:hypothetical protein
MTGGLSRERNSTVEVLTMGVAGTDSLIQARRQPEDYFKSAFTGQVVGGFHSSLYLAGYPGAGSAPAAGVNGAQIDRTRSGVIPFPAPAASKSPYLNVVDFAAAAGVGSAWLWDRMWENSGLSVTSTGAQAIAPVALPPRDANGSANGVGVIAALEIVTAMGAATATATLTYTDSDGNAGATGTCTIPSGAVAGTLLFFTLAAGDYGVKAPTSFQLSGSMVSGSFSVVLGRRVGRSLRCPSANIGDSFGPADGGGPLFDSSALQWVYLLSATAVGAQVGSVQIVQG